MFNKYQGKAIERLAHEVSSIDVITKVDKESTSSIDIDGVQVEFGHHSPVSIGDFIIYLDDNDIYHCPREVFLKRNHVEGVDLDFGTAVKVMKLGGKVARKGWNGKGMWVIYNPGSKGETHSMFDGSVYKMHGVDECEILPHFDMYTVNHSGRRAMLPGWAASQSDINANDWFVVE